MSVSRNSIVENMQMLCVKSGLKWAVGNMQILWVNGDFKVCCRKYAKVAILILERGGRWILFGKGIREKIRERREEHEVQISGRIHISETSTYPPIISYM